MDSVACQLSVKQVIVASIGISQWAAMRAQVSFVKTVLHFDVNL